MADAAFSFAQGNLAKLCALPKYAFSVPVSWCVPRSEDRWVFGSGAGVGEGALALARELRRSEPRARIRWLVASESEARLARAAGFDPVQRVGWRGFYETLRAGTVVVTHGLGDANRFGLFGARVVQLWHGAPLKRLHLDSAVTTEVRGPALLRSLLHRMYRLGSDRITVFVAGSETAASRIVSAFQIAPDRVAVLGDPRDDLLAQQAQDPALAESARTEVRRLLGLPHADATTLCADGLPQAPLEKLVLYAPTWRDGDADPAIPSDGEAAAIQAWAKQAGARLVIRSHPLGAGAYSGVLGERVHEFNVGLARDVTPHLGAFDAVITDYSSIAIDFALLGRPIVWFAPDLEAYESTRGLYEPLAITSGGAVVRTWAETLSRLEAVGVGGAEHEESLAQTSELVKRFYAYPDGGAAARVLQKLRGSQPVDRSQPTVFFESFYGRSVSCNPLAIDAEITRRLPLARRFWSVANTDQPVPAGATAVLEGSEEWHRARADADLLVVNDWLRRGFRRRRGQVVLQTWHGTMLKHLALGRPGVSLRTHIAIRRESRRWSIMLSQNSHASAQFRRSYAFRGPILETGYPRDDRLARSLTGAAAAGGQATEAGTRRDPELVRIARASLGIDTHTRVLVYAPTWRDAGTELVDELDVAQLATELGPEWIVLARGHTRTHGFGSYAGVVDVSQHPDVNDVILAADVLVTDFSSLMFDASVARVPLIFFVPDLAAYRDSERGFTFDFEAMAPGPLVARRADVVQLARDIERDGDEADWLLASDTQATAWRARFNPHDDGRAAERVVTELQRRGVLPGTAAHGSARLTPKD